MIIDNLENCARYFSLHANFAAAFQYLQSTDLISTPAGRYPIKDDDLFAVISEYETKPSEGEQMESHRRYIDIQFLISGKEKMGISLLNGQQISKPYSDESDFSLYADAPNFFIELAEGSFVIFYPTDLHAPTLLIDKPERVKKVVLKIAVG